MSIRLADYNDHRQERESGPDTQTSVEKALRILTCFSPEEPELGVSEVARRVGIGVSTAHRLLNLMVQEDFVRQNLATSKYSLGYRVVHLASTVLAGANFRTLCLPYMRQLRDETEETVCAYIMAARERICVEEVPGLHEIRASGTIGRALPLYMGAAGKVLLAQLPEDDVAQIVAEGVQRGRLSPEAERTLRDELSAIRAAGYACSTHEAEAVASSLAAPVRNFTGAAIGSLAITGPQGRWSPERMKAVAPQLVELTSEISRELGHTARPQAPKTLRDVGPQPA